MPELMPHLDNQDLYDQMEWDQPMERWIQRQDRSDDQQAIVRHGPKTLCLAVRRRRRTLASPDWAWTHPLLAATDPRAGVFGYDRVTTLADIQRLLRTPRTRWSWLKRRRSSSGCWLQGGPATVRGSIWPGSLTLGQNCPVRWVASGRGVGGDGGWVSALGQAIRCRRRCLRVCQRSRVARGCLRIGDRQAHEFEIAAFTAVYVIGRMMRVIVGLGFSLCIHSRLTLRQSEKREVPGARCISNLHNIVLGVLGYESANGVFPAGSWPNPVLEPESRLSWYAQILPQLDEQDKYDALEQDGPWDSGQNLVMAHERKKLLDCERAALTAPGSPEPASYVGIAGLGKDAARLPKSDARAGVFGYDRQTILPDIKDGRRVKHDDDRGDGERGAGRGYRRWLGDGPWAGSNASSDRISGCRPAIRRPARTLCTRGQRQMDRCERIQGNSFAVQIFEGISTIAGSEKLPADWADAQFYSGK